MKRIITFCLFIFICFISIKYIGIAQDKNDTTGKSKVEVLTPSPLNRIELRAGGINPKAVSGVGAIQTLISSSASPTTLGATIGGSKDIGYIRNQINEGYVPKFVDFSAEGLYSEHDILTPQIDCSEKLCLSLGYGYAPTADNNSNALFVHLGLSSGVKIDEFKRPPLQLCLVIDRSGSMSEQTDGSSKVTKIQAIKTAIVKLLDKLNSDDLLSVVTFENSAEVIIPQTKINSSNKDDLIKAINSINADGGTNIEQGLFMGYELLEQLPEVNGTNKRIMLFTDAQPNSGATDSVSFTSIIKKYSDKKIGFSAFGVGLDFGQELIYNISKLRGANYFYLENSDKISKVFDKEFDFLVTPIVFDLNVKITTPQGLKLKAVYGLPNWKEGDKDANLEIPTVFFSSNKGAIILRYEKDDSSPLIIKKNDELVSGSISYSDPLGKNYNSSIEVRNQAKATLIPGTQYYSHDGMKEAVALTNIFFGLRDGCMLNTEGKTKEALAAISRAKTLAMVENLYMNDSGLKTEIKLLEKLSENISKGGKPSALGNTKKNY
ncbi:MAG: VWA domain-containing protein [Chlorobi bacterium]|nr:VWA domain-containing protein [Chlorobiota bacterium]